MADEEEDWMTDSEEEELVVALCPNNHRGSSKPQEKGDEEEKRRAALQEMWSRFFTTKAIPESEGLRALEAVKKRLGIVDCRPVDDNDGGNDDDVEAQGENDEGEEEEKGHECNGNSSTEHTTTSTNKQRRRTKVVEGGNFSIRETERLYELTFYLCRLALHVLRCGSCGVELCRRGQHVELVADRGIVLYSTDFVCSRTVKHHNTKQTKEGIKCACKAFETRCMKCDHALGYHVREPCAQCLSAAHNNHYWMFHRKNVSPSLVLELVKQPVTTTERSQHLLMTISRHEFLRPFVTWHTNTPSLLDTDEKTIDADVASWPITTDLLPFRNDIGSGGEGEDEGLLSSFLAAVECPICLCIPVDRVLFPTCGHAFCETCGVREADTFRRCPLCRVDLPKGATPVPDFAFRSAARSEIRVRCRWGCKWDDAQRKIVQLPRTGVSGGCPRYLPIQDLAKHVEEECPHRLTGKIPQHKDVN